MGLPLFVAKLIGRGIAKKLDLQEGQMEGTKSKWKSQTVWAGIFVFLRGAYVLAQTTIAPQFGWNLPEIPGWVDAVVGGILGTAVIDGRMKATRVIK